MKKLNLLLSILLLCVLYGCTNNTELEKKVNSINSNVRALSRNVAGLADQVNSLEGGAPDNALAYYIFNVDAAKRILGGGDYTIKIYDLKEATLGDGSQSEGFALIAADERYRTVGTQAYVVNRNKDCPTYCLVDVQGTYTDLGDANLSNRISADATEKNCIVLDKTKLNAMMKLYKYIGVFVVNYQDITIMGIGDMQTEPNTMRIHRGL